MRKIVLIVCSLALLGLVFAPPASAEVLYLTSYLTFSGPVALPGVTLAAGTYLFRFPNRNGAPSVIQVLSKDRKLVYAMLMTIPRTRLEPTDKHVVAFKEVRADAPLRLQTWFLPGRSIGHELLYPAASAKPV